MLSKITQLIKVILVLFMCSGTAFSQKQFTGQIINPITTEALPGVQIKNQSNGKNAVTSSDGKFSIQYNNETDSIRITYVGYTTKTITISDAKPVIGLSESSITLNKVVVTGTRNAKDRNDLPMAMTTLSPGLIQDTKATSTDQILNKAPGVYMVDLGNEQHSMSMRQPMSFKSLFLYLEDGIPIRTTGIFNHNALLEMNMASFKNIEVIRGPASSLYGSEAIGGAINFITLNPTAFLTAKASIQANNLGFKRADLLVSDSHKKWGYLLTGNFAQRTNGYRDHSDYQKLALTGKLTYKLNEKSFWRTSFTYVDYVSDMTGSLDSNSFYESEYSSVQSFTNRDVAALRLSSALHYYWNNKSKSTATVYFRNNAIRQNPSYRIKDDYSPWGNPNGDKSLAHSEQNENAFKTFGAILQHKHKISFWNTEITAGLTSEYSPSQYYANYISVYKNPQGIYESFNSTDSVLTDYTTGLLNNAGYLQVEINPVKKLKVSGAVRYDQFIYDYDNHLDSTAFSGAPDSKNNFAALTPKIGLMYNFKKNLSAYANYSQGFVPPQVSELYRGVTVPTLQPAVFNNYEIGFLYTFLKEKATLDIALYRLDGLNEILSVQQPSGDYANENAGKTRHEGIEYGLNIQPHKTVHFRFSGTNAVHEFLEYSEKGNDYSGNEMPNAPKWIANSEITYKPSQIPNFRIGLEWQHMGPYFMDSQNTLSYDGFDVFNLRLGYSIKGFEIWTNIMNIADNVYAVRASKSAWGQSYNPGDPRTFTIGLSYQFKDDK